MKLTDKQKKTQKLLQTIFYKAWEDVKFKEELVANPIEAIEKATGERVYLPEGKKLVVIDQTDKSMIYINIPPEPKIEDMELNEEQLETIAGGGGILPIIIPTLPTDPDQNGY